MKTIFFMPNATIEQRITELKKIAHSESEETYNRTLTESEIEREKTGYVENGIRLRDVELEAKQSADQFKAKKTVIEKEMQEQLERVQNRSKKVFDTLYGVVNPDTRQMQFFDKFGELISTRGLTPDEFNEKMFDNEGEAAKPAGAYEIGYVKQAPEFEDAQYEDVSDIEDVSDVFEPDDDDDLPEFLKPDGGEGKEPQETAKKPRKTRGKGKYKGQE